VPLSVWDAASIAVKTMTYAATLGAAGAVFFLRVCGPLIAGADRPRIRSLVVGLAALAVFAGGAQILVSAGSMGDDAAGMWDGSLIHMVWQAGAGRANAIRAIGLLLAALGVLSGRPPWWALLGAAMAATSFAWTGHARALNPDGLPVLLVSVHLLGVAFWLGALAPLLIVSRNADATIIAATAARFGSSAVVVVGALMAAGIALLWMLLGDVTALWSSTYGRSVMLKLAFVGCLLCFAAFNKLRLTPRLLAGDARAVQNLRASIRFEMILGAVILAVTASFTTLIGPPALG
jgi:putative copper resistance protein D